MTQACVSLDEVLAAAAARAASLVPETSGYLALAVADATSRLPYQHDDRAVLLTIDGSVMVPRKGAVAPPPEAGRGLRDLLRRLLASSTGSMPGLTSAARPRSEEIDVDRVVSDIEAALIPVNRAAAKRALARLARETLRAKELGKLRRKPSQALAAAASSPAIGAPVGQGGSLSRNAAQEVHAPSAISAPVGQGGSLSRNAAPETHAPSATPKKQEPKAIQTERAAVAPPAPAAAVIEAPLARAPAVIEAPPVRAIAPAVEAPPPVRAIAPAVEAPPPARAIAPVVEGAAPRVEMAPPAMPASIPRTMEVAAPRTEIAPPPMVIAPILTAHDAPAPHAQIAPPPMVTAPILTAREDFAPRAEIAPPAVAVAPVVNVTEASAPRAEIAPPAVVIAPVVNVTEASARRPEIAPPVVAVAPVVNVTEASAPCAEIAPPPMVTAPIVTAEAAEAAASSHAPTPTPFHVEVAFEVDESTSAPAPAVPAIAAPAFTIVPDAAPIVADAAPIVADAAPMVADAALMDAAPEPDADATIVDPEAMAVIEASYQASEEASPIPAILTPPPALAAAPEPSADTGDDALTRPWRPVTAVVDRDALVHTPTASASHAVLLSELGGTRADELLEAFQPQDHGDRALAAAASSLRALAGVDLTQPPRTAAPRQPVTETPSYLRAAATAPSRARTDDDLDGLSPIPPPRAMPATTTRWPLALFALGVLVLFAAWLYRPTLARDFFGLRQLLAPQPAPQIEAPPPANPALATPAPPGVSEPPAPATPSRASTTRASGAGDGQHRRRD